MIISFFNHGTGKANGAIKYLLSEKDSVGKLREPPPEVFYGDEDITRILIDTSQRKFKYTSGVIAFRDSEKPTDKQLQQIVKSFYETFAPGLGPDKVNSFIVRHEDKGNTELHFIVPMVEVSTMKRFNINPPGKYSQMLSRDFQAVWNHKLGYDQVIEDPLKAQLNKFEMKADHQGTSKKIKSRTGSEISKLIRSGKIGNREQLCEYLENHGIEVTRRGNDYISVKLPNQKKASRLYGPVYQKNADYPSLVKQADEAFQNNKKLNDFQLFEVTKRIQKTIEVRKEFNSKTYVFKPKRIPKGYRPKETKPINEKTATNNQPLKTHTEQPKQTKLDNPKDQLGTTPKARRTGSQNATNSPSTKVMSTGATTSLRASLASVQVNIISALADLSNAKTPEEKAKVERRLAELRVQEAKLQYELEEAKKAELNQNSPRRGPKPR